MEDHNDDDDNLKYLDESKINKKLFEKLKTIKLLHYCEICKRPIYRFDNFIEIINLNYCKYNHQQK